jgi:hypothetical protein
VLRGLAFSLIVVNADYAVSLLKYVPNIVVEFPINSLKTVDV